MNDIPDGYPAHRAVDVVLRDGATVRIRPARADDRERVEDYLIGLSDQSRYLRFGGVSVDVSEISRRATDVDYRDHLTLLAFAEGEGGDVVGGAQYIREGDAPRAEVSVSIADGSRATVSGSILVAHLADAAGEAGIIDVPRPRAAREPPHDRRLPSQRLRRASPGHARGGGRGVPDRARPRKRSQAYESHERVAAANAVRAIVRPSSVAVIGASRNPDSIGGRLLHNLLAPPFAGVVHAVNPKAAVVQGIAAYPSVLDIPGRSTWRSSRSPPPT